MADFSGFIPFAPADCIMVKIKKTPRARQRPLEPGQVWRMPKARMQIQFVGKLLVHYKLGKPGAVRVHNSVGGKKSVEKYLKANKAVLMRKKAA
jgi:hypothetical protein